MGCHCFRCSRFQCRGPARALSDHMLVQQLCGHVVRVGAIGSRSSPGAWGRGGWQSGSQTRAPASQACGRPGTCWGRSSGHLHTELAHPGPAAPSLDSSLLPGILRQARHTWARGQLASLGNSSAQTQLTRLSLLHGVQGGNKCGYTHHPPREKQTKYTFQNPKYLFSENDVCTHCLSWSHLLTAQDPLNTPHPSLVCPRAPCPHTPCRASVLCWRTKLPHEAHAPPSVVTSRIVLHHMPACLAQPHTRASLDRLPRAGHPFALLVSAAGFPCRLRLGSTVRVCAAGGDTSSCPCPTVPSQLGLYRTLISVFKNNHDSNTVITELKHRTRMKTPW